MHLSSGNAPVTSTQDDLAAFQGDCRTFKIGMVSWLVLLMQWQCILRTTWSNNSGDPFIYVVSFRSSATVAWRIQADVRQLLLNALGAGRHSLTFHRAL